jgi:hypothetical protein
MAVEDEPVICEICKQGRVTKRMEEMAFRQWSDKGYIHCRVTILPLRGLVSAAPECFLPGPAEPHGGDDQTDH